MGVSVPFWAAAQLQPQRDGLALHCLRQAGFEVYAPRLRERRTVNGREAEEFLQGYLEAKPMPADQVKQAAEANTKGR
jgi:hypothetical protein